MRRPLLICLLLAACESTAMNLDFPDESAVEVRPQFMQGEVREVQFTFVGFAADNAEGDPQAWTVLSWDFGDENLELAAWEFASNFRLNLRIRRFGNAAEGQHALRITIRNHFGTFTGTGEFFVF